MTAAGLALDLFAGAGGWEIGARGLVDFVIGVELDALACATRSAAGLPTIRADASALPLRGRIDGLIASPPCQDFSRAGKRAGLDGRRGQLMVTVSSTAQRLAPRWVACEQVPEALPALHAEAAKLEALDFYTWCGVLNAADYGAPQSRRRAILMASYDCRPVPPAPTHAQAPHPSLLGAELLPWVTMAEALGWPPGWLLDRRQTGAPVIKTWRRPAPTVTGTAVGRGVWTVTHSETGARRKLSITDALTLQTFPTTWPLAGSLSSQGLQVGNAVPPLLARAVLAALLNTTANSRKANK